MTTHVPTRPAPPDLRLDVGAWCPLDDTVLTLELIGWSCPRCGGAWDHAGRRGWWLTRTADLGSRLVAEDNLQTAGLLDEYTRATCGLCRAWMTAAHQASAAHRAAVDAAATRIAAAELYAVACTVPVPDGPVDGMCWQPAPCPDHADREATVRRLHTADRVLAGGFIATAVGLSGLQAGRWLLPWAHLVPGWVPWALFTLLVAAAVGYLVVVGLLWWADERRYAGTTLLDDPTGWWSR